LTVATYWLRPFQPLRTNPGMHRFVWDLTGPAATGGGRGGPSIAAVPGDSPVRQGAWQPTGNYTVKLTVDGQVYTQTLTVKPDPRAR